MTLRFKVGTGPAYPYRVLRRHKPPVVGDTFQIQDMTQTGSKPLTVRLTLIKTEAYDNLYFVEMA